MRWWCRRFRSYKDDDHCYEKNFRHWVWAKAENIFINGSKMCITVNLPSHFSMYITIIIIMVYRDLCHIVHNPMVLWNCWHCRHKFLQAFSLENTKAEQCIQWIKRLEVELNENAHLFHLTYACSKLMKLKDFYMKLINF